MRKLLINASFSQVIDLLLKIFKIRIMPKYVSNISSLQSQALNTVDQKAFSKTIGLNILDITSKTIDILSTAINKSTQTAQLITNSDLSDHTLNSTTADAFINNIANSLLSNKAIIYKSSRASTICTYDKSEAAIVDMSKGFLIDQVAKTKIAQNAVTGAVNIAETMLNTTINTADALLNVDKFTESTILNGIEIAARIGNILSVYVKPKQDTINQNNNSENSFVNTLHDNLKSACNFALENRELFRKFARFSVLCATSGPCTAFADVIQGQIVTQIITSKQITNIVSTAYTGIKNAISGAVNTGWICVKELYNKIPQLKI